MTNRPRKPQVPTGKRTTPVRQQTSWEDGRSNWGVLHGNAPAYDRLPKPPPPPEPAPALTILPAPKPSA